MKVPSNEEKILYALVSLIIHECCSFDIENYYKDVLYFNAGILCHCDYDEITQISDCPEDVYTR